MASTARAGWQGPTHLWLAGVVELVDAPDSKSGSARSVGSIPTARTNLQTDKATTAVKSDWRVVFLEVGDAGSQGTMVGKGSTSRTICERTLTRDVEGVLSTVIVRMDAPVQDKKRWTCTYHITGMADARCGAGADSFQAIQDALDGIRSYLDAQPGTFTSLHAANDAGFPRSISAKYGVAFSRTCEKLIATAEAKLLRDLARWRAKIARRGLIPGFGPVAYTRMADRKATRA